MNKKTDLKFAALMAAIAFSVVGALMIPQAAPAQSTPNNYSCQTTSVTSSSVPVNVLPVNRMTTWQCHTRAGGSTTILIFPYPAAIPTAVPSPVAVMEVGIGSYFGDAVSCPAATCVSGIGEAWAGVLSGGSSATTMDCCWR